MSTQDLDLKCIWVYRQLVQFLKGWFWHIVISQTQQVAKFDIKAAAYFSYLSKLNVIKLFLMYLSVKVCKFDHECLMRCIVSASDAKNSTFG